MHPPHLPFGSDVAICRRTLIITHSPQKSSSNRYAVDGRAEVRAQSLEALASVLPPVLVISLYASPPTLPSKYAPGPGVHGTSPKAPPLGLPTMLNAGDLMLLLCLAVYDPGPGVPKLPADWVFR